MIATRHVVLSLVACWPLGCSSSPGASDGASEDQVSDDSGTTGASEDGDGGQSDDGRTSDGDAGDDDGGDSVQSDACPVDRPNLCPSGCVDFDSDEENCGRCGKVCERSCSDGRCVDRHWREPEQLAGSQSDGGMLELAIDPRGNAWVVRNRTADEGQHLVLSRFDAGTQVWGQEEPLDADTEKSDRPLGIAAWPNGNVLLVGTRHIPSSEGTVHVAWVYDAEAEKWGEAAELSEGDTSKLWGSAMAVGANGDAIIAWAAGASRGRRVYAQRLDGERGSWGRAEVVVEDDGLDYRWPEVAMDSEGNAVVAWTDRNEVWSLYTRRFDRATKTWQEAERLEDDERGDADDLQLGVDALGNVFASWRQDLGSHRSVFTSRYDIESERWSGAERLEFSDRERAGQPALAVRPDGSAVVAWDQFRSREASIWASTYDPETGAWSEPVGVEAAGHGSEGFVGQLFVAADHHGGAMVAWLQEDIYDSDFDSAWSIYQQSPKSQTWTEPELLESSNAAPVDSLVLKMASDGDALALWQYHNEDSDVDTWWRHFH